MLVYNYGSKKNEIMRESWIYKEKSWGIVTQPKGFLGEVFLNDLSSVSPSFLVCTCKKQQAKACWKCCKTHPKCYKKFLFLHRNFTCENLNWKIYVLTYLREVLATEKWNEMTEKYQIQIKGQEFVQAMAGNCSKVSAKPNLVRQICTLNKMWVQNSIV